MTDRPDAVVAGHICLDVIPDLSESDQDKFEKMFLPGRLLELGPVSFCTGGPVSNTGLVLHKLGLDVQLMGKVGDDLFGQAVKQIVNGYSPELGKGMVTDPEVATSYTLVINPPDSDRILLHCTGANDTFKADDIRYDLVSRARLFHFGYPPLMKLMYTNDGIELVEIYRRVKESGVTTSLDMALPDPSTAAGQVDWQTILKGALPYVDVFLPSIEEILYMLRRDTYLDLVKAAGSPNFLPFIKPGLLSDLSQELLDLGAKIVCLKLGERGLYLRTAEQAAIESLGPACPTDPALWANQELWSPCFEVEVVGTVGSGDSTIAGFLAGLLRDLTPAKTLSAAVAVGACSVEGPDALSGIRSWDETTSRMESDWSKHALNLDSVGWTFDEQNQVWAKS